MNLYFTYHVSNQGGGAGSVNAEKCWRYCNRYTIAYQCLYIQAFKELFCGKSGHHIIRNNNWISILEPPLCRLKLLSLMLCGQRRLWRMANMIDTKLNRKLSIYMTCQHSSTIYTVYTFKNWVVLLILKLILLHSENLTPRFSMIFGGLRFSKSV